MTSKFILPALAAVLFCIVSFGAYISPYTFPADIRNAAEARDTRALNRYIDYPDVVISLADSAARNVNPSFQEDAWTLAYIMYDAFFTPANTVSFYRNNNPQAGQAEIVFTEAVFDPDSYERRYVDLTTFEYRVDTKVANGFYTEYTITAKRTGILDWQIRSVDFVMKDDPTVGVPMKISAPEPEPKAVEQQLMSEVESSTLLITTDRNIHCVRDGNAITCVNKTNDALYCTQRFCEYDESGTVTFRDTGTVTTGTVQYGYNSCVFGPSSVRCNASEAPGSITSEYVEAPGA